jgi:putative ABC transport system permease protein
MGAAVRGDFADRSASLTRGMRLLKIVRLRLRSVFRGRRVEHELADELRDHLERQIEGHVAAGLSREAARAAARREFGNVALVEEQCRDTRRVTWLEDLVRDVAYAVRSMRRTPGHTAVAALSLALGIGANTATFSLVNALLLRSLPVAEPQALVELGTERPDGPGNLSYPLYERVRDQNSTFSSVAAVSAPVFRADDDGSDEPPLGRYVSGNFFEALGVRPALGRLLARDDDRLDSPNGAAVTVISDGLWKRKFGGDPGVVGRTLTIGGRPSRAGISFTIVGVLPQQFQGVTVGRFDDFYLPLASEPGVNSRSLRNSPNAGWLKVLARLKPGITRAAAKADIDVIASRPIDDGARSSSEAARQRQARRMTVESARTGLSGPRREFGRAVLLLMGAVALVLVVACANVINLLLARGVARRGEIGVRLAIGASPGRLVRQFLAESAVLGLIGGGVGLGFAVWGTPPIARLMANDDPAIVYDVAPDATVLMFTLLVSLVAALAAGLVPALRVSRTRVPSLREDASARHAGAGLSIWSQGLIAFQVALSLLLLAGALLLVTTLRNFRTGDFGFDREGIVSMSLETGRAGYTGERRLAYFRAVLERARNTPGVLGAALSLGVPAIGAGVNTSFGVEGQPRDPEAMAFINDVTQGYFEVTGTKLLRGRDFGPQDGAGSTRVAIINETIARRYFGTGNPIGQRVRAGIRGGVLEIVGVVATAKYESLTEADSPIVYVHALQSADEGALSLVVRTAGDPLATGLLVRRSVQELAPVRVAPPVTLSSQIDRALVEERLIARVLGAFAILAVVLAAAGLYGVLAYSTTRRTAEIGIRMALGATRGAVLWPIVAESGKLAAVGIAIGIPAALALTRLLSNLLYGVTPTDARVLGAVVLCLLVVALSAALVPAWRASRVNPLVALRYE